MQKAVLVNAGGYGMLSAEGHDYDHLVQILEERFRDKGIKVVITKNQNETEKEAPSAECVIYMTRGMLQEAVDIKAKFPVAQVFLLTGLVPEECQPTEKAGIHNLLGVTVVNKGIGFKEFSKVLFS